MSTSTLTSTLRELELEENDLYTELSDHEAGFGVRSFSEIMRDLDAIEVKIEQIKASIEAEEGN